MKRFAAAVLALAATAPAWAVVDQANDGVFSGGFDISSTPIGQGFVPTLNSVNFVDLLINDQNPAFGTAVDIAVNIRAGGIAGAILGTSGTVSFADQAPMPFQLPEVVHFTFAAPVALAPGSLYVIEPVKLGGLSDLGVFGTGFGIDAYPAGDSYFMGAPFVGQNAPFDLWFREGVAPVPEPETHALMLLGLAAVGGWLRRRRRS